MLYRMFSAEDELLYVGLTCNPTRRMENHSSSKPWWSTVARIEMEHFPDRPSVKAAERAAIKSEKPAHNIRMNGTTVNLKPSELGCANCGYADRRPHPICQRCGHYHVAEYDQDEGIVGLWFHSWETDEEGNRRRRWQGQVIAEPDCGCLVQLYSWWDGTPSEKRLLDFKEMSDFTFYFSDVEMNVSVGCRELFSVRRHGRDGECGGMATHRTPFGSYVCYRCAKHYAGSVEVTL